MISLEEEEEEEYTAPPPFPKHKFTTLYMINNSKTMTLSKNLKNNIQTEHCTAHKKKKKKVEEAEH